MTAALESGASQQARAKVPAAKTNTVGLTGTGSQSTTAALESGAPQQDSVESRAAGTKNA
ncbi:hypothetical protein HMPREF2975_08660 [Actinomyces sp. HMSC065F12]|nr:hypothetical protein HMPREF2975_08660 [Actinomyces sp. HMSC065F12]